MHKITPARPYGLEEYSNSCITTPNYSTGLVRIEDASSVSGGATSTSFSLPYNFTKKSGQLKSEYTYIMAFILTYRSTSVAKPTSVKVDNTYSMTEITSYTANTMNVSAWYLSQSSLSGNTSSTINLAYTSSSYVCAVFCNGMFGTSNYFNYRVDGDSATGRTSLTNTFTSDSTSDVSKVYYPSFGTIMLDMAGVKTNNALSTTQDGQNLIGTANNSTGTMSLGVSYRMVTDRSKAAIQCNRASLGVNLDSNYTSPISLGWSWTGSVSCVSKYCIVYGRHKNLFDPREI